MVGVPKSTGCLVCRKRKIKCDETWPACLNCQKNSKSCPGPPARHTFKDLGPGLVVTTPNILPIAERHAAVPDSDRRYLTQVQEKFTGGSVFYKHRLSYRDTSHHRKLVVRSASTSTAGLIPLRYPLLRQPSSTQHHELSRALVATINAGSRGLQMSVFGPFIHEVPARIGFNPALDAAAAVLIDAHTSLMYKKSSNDVVSINLYLRAIRMLQRCLDDPQEGMSTNTLCASVLLGIVEALAGPRNGNRYLAHVGGAGRLMELQGAGQFVDPFAKDILRFNRAGIIVSACFERKSCFLTAPEWLDVAFENNGLSFDDRLHTDLLRAFAQLPEILKDLKELNILRKPSIGAASDVHNDSCIDPNLDRIFEFEQSPPETCPSLDFSVDSPENADLSSEGNKEGVPNYGASFAYISARDDVLCKIQNLRHSFCALGVNMHAKFNDGTTAVKRPSVQEGNPLATSYHFNSWRDNVGYNSFWALCIIMNGYLIKLLPPSDPVIPLLESESRSLALEICKTWEEAWSSKPIGALHTTFSFVVAYEYVAPNIQEWILQDLNSLLDFQRVDTFRWTDTVVRMMSGRLTGDELHTTFSNVTPPNKAQ